MRETMATMQRVTDKVHAPGLVRRDRPCPWWLAMCGTDMATRSFGPQLQPFLALQSVHAFVIDGPAFTAQQHVDPLVAVADPRPGDLTNTPSQRVLRWPPGLTPDH